MASQKLFTLREAQEVLQSVLPHVAEMVSLKQSLDRKGYDVYRHQYLGGIGPNGQKAFPLELERFIEVVRSLNHDGIEIKDFNRGLIDFPYKRKNGEIVYLCYLLGEPEIEAWHAIDAGFAGRQQLSEL